MEIYKNNARFLHIAGCYLIKQANSYQKIYLETKPGWFHRAWSDWWLGWMWIDCDNENVEEHIEHTQQCINKLFKQ